MKISSAQQNLSSSHLELEQREVSERLRAWTGSRPPREEAQRPEPTPRPASGNSAPVSISPQARALALTPPPQLTPPTPTVARPSANSIGTPESSALSEAIDGGNGDPMLMLLRGMLERMFGIHFKLFDSAEMQVDAAQAERTQEVALAATGGGQNGWGIEYEYHERRTEIETTRFAAQGIVKTADGMEISFELSLEMTRSYSESIDISIRAGDAARKKDPLIVNFGGSAAQLSDQRFEIDLDGDGSKETARFAARGSGFLVFDRNANGKIDNRSEMFGPTTGDGFAELAAFDGDHNGWIDENDAIYAQLRVWTKKDDGSDVLRTLKESDVGAISLARLATPFAIKDSNNALLGQVRSSGVYLSDDGKAGTVQQVDLAV